MSGGHSLKTLRGWGVARSNVARHPDGCVVRVGGHPCVSRALLEAESCAHLSVNHGDHMARAEPGVRRTPVAELGLRQTFASFQFSPLNTLADLGRGDDRGNLDKLRNEVCR